MRFACTRRDLLGAAALAATIAPPARAAEPARLLVAGPPGGPLDLVAAALQAVASRGLAGGAGIEVQAAGGADGVTGANQFQSRFAAEGEGTALLLVPGAAATSWLAGDSRVQYDAARWLPLLCGLGSGVLASRRPIEAASAGAPWRLAVPDPLGAAAPCLLGLDLLAVPAEPRASPDAPGALAAGQVDAAFMPGPGAAGMAAGAGAVPVFSLGAPDLPADLPALGRRDPAWPDLPSLAELISRAAPGDPGLLAALHAVAAAALLDFALVLPALTPAPTVALWREVAARAAEAPELRAALPAGIRPVAAPGCGAVQAAIAIEPAALLAYRRWLVDRVGYRPG